METHWLASPGRALAFPKDPSALQEAQIAAEELQGARDLATACPSGAQSPSPHMGERWGWVIFNAPSSSEVLSC